MLDGIKNIFRFPCEARMAEAVSRHSEACTGAVEDVRAARGVIANTVTQNARRMSFDNLIHGAGL